MASPKEGAEAGKPEGEEPRAGMDAQESTGAVSTRPLQGAVEGIVATANGPLEKAVVWFSASSTLTDAKGRFVLEHLPAGVVTLQVTPPTPRFQNSTTYVTVEADKKANVFVFLGEAGGTVAGVVTDENGHALVGAEVYGVFRATKGAESVKVDDKGRYSFKDVPPGTHFVRAKAPGFMIEGKSVDAIGSRHTTCDFALKPGSLSLVGKVTDPEGRGVDAEVYLLSGGVVVSKHNTKAGDGSYAFDDLIPAAYELTIISPGFAAKGWAERLEKNEKVEFKLEAQVIQETSPDQSSTPG